MDFRTDGRPGQCASRSSAAACSSAIGSNGAPHRAPRLRQAASARLWLALLASQLKFCDRLQLGEQSWRETLTAAARPPGQELDAREGRKRVRHDGPIRARARREFSRAEDTHSRAESKSRPGPSGPQTPDSMYARPARSVTSRSRSSWHRVRSPLWTGAGPSVERPKSDRGNSTSTSRQLCGDRAPAMRPATTHRCRRVEHLVPSRRGSEPVRPRGGHPRSRGSVSLPGLFSRRASAVRFG